MKNIPSFIVEIYKDISLKKKEEVVNILEQNIDGEIKLYDSKYYIWESEFSEKIFNERKKELEYVSLN